MVEKNSHNVENASTQAQAASSPQAGEPSTATQKLAAAESAPKEGASDKTRVLGEAKAAASGPSATPDVVPAVNAPVDSVAARRAAHGLAPEATSETDAAKEKARDKDASAEDRKRKVQRQHKARLIRRTIIAIVLVIIIGIIVGFWLLRWGLHDDVASIQGKWRVQGTDTVIEINDEEIILTDEVAYDYVLDPEAKTLTFKFGALTGDGRYRFSLDHNMLAIDDGEFDAMGTLATDIPWMLDALSQKLLANHEKSPGLEDGNMVLERVE